MIDIQGSESTNLLYHFIHHIKEKVYMKNKNDDNLPVICSKCNMTFQTESDYLQHYDEKHKSEHGPK
jgi:uncharacterized C2H2 Zn-finger protein